MAKKKAVTGQITKRFTLEELEMIIEALCMYKDAGHRVRCAVFNADGDMVSKDARDSIDSREFSAMLSKGEWQLRHVPVGPSFTYEENDTADKLWDIFVMGLGKIEEKIEQNIEETVQENIGGVIDDLYTMLKGEKQ
jgi:hypothetical protein